MKIKVLFIIFKLFLKLLKKKTGCNLKKNIISKWSIIFLDL